MLSCETNRLLFAFGKWFKKFVHAFFFEASAFFTNSGSFHKFAIYLDTILFVKYKMVVLTIVTQKNGETIYFEEPIPKVHFMKLISCNLYNSWDTLKKEGSATLGDKDKDIALSVSKLLPGHYNLESLAKEIDGLFDKYGY